MDFHKLQHMLNEIEPSDRNRDIELLRRAAQGNNDRATKQEISESTPSVARVDQEPLTEAAQMAALAGIPVSESQKKGKAGQLKGRDKVSKSNTSRSGEQKNVTRGKLVGSIDNNEEVEEGEKWDQFKKGFKNPGSASQVAAAAKKVFTPGKGSKSSSKSSKSSTRGSSDLPPKLSQSLAKYSTPLSNISRNPDLKKQFQELMKAADPNLQLEAYLESKKKYSNSENKTILETTATPSNKDSIKAELFRRLNQTK